jgi:hypothetical protein
MVVADKVGAVFPAAHTAGESAGGQVVFVLVLVADQARLLVIAEGVYKKSKINWA